MTLPQLAAMQSHWEALPPPAAQLRRIALALGIPDTKKTPQRPARTPDEALHEAMGAGMPVMEGRPDDPMLDLVGW